MVDHSVIRRCIDRDERSLQLCYDQCSPYVYAIIKTYISNHQDRKDVMQQAFIEIFNSLTSFDPEKGQFKSWLSTITYRQCVKHLKKQNKLDHFVTYDHKQHDVVDRTLADRLGSCSREEVEELLGAMPEGYRTVFVMYTLDGLPHKEIASILDITSETSRSQFSRAIKWIRKNLLTESKQFIYGQY